MWQSHLAVSHPLHNSVGAHPVTLHLFSVREYDQFMSVVCPAVSRSFQHSSISCPVTGLVVTHPAVTCQLHISVATIPVTLDLFCWWICDQDVSVAHPVVSELSQHTSVSSSVAGVAVSLVGFTSVTHSYVGSYTGPLELVS